MVVKYMDNRGYNITFEFVVYSREIFFHTFPGSTKTLMVAYSQTLFKQKHCQILYDYLYITFIEVYTFSFDDLDLISDHFQGELKYNEDSCDCFLHFECELSEHLVLF